MKPYDKPAKRAAITLLCVLTGNALLAFLVAAFIIPHDIIMGGTTGIGIVLHKAIPQLDVSLFVLILNAVLLLGSRTQAHWVPKLKTVLLLEDDAQGK